MSQRTKDFVGVIVILFGIAVGYVGAFPLKSVVGFLVGICIVALGGIMCAPDLFKTAFTNFGTIAGPYLPSYGRRDYDQKPEESK